MISFKEFFIYESIKTYSDLKEEEVYFVIELIRDEIVIYMYKRPQKFIIRGFMERNKNNLWNMHVESKRNEKGYVYKKQGYGPLLYDIAIELSCRYGNGLIPSIVALRGDTSLDAENVYKYYYEKRNDINKEKLNLEKIYSGKELQRLIEYILNKPWLSTIYSKENTNTLNELEKNGKIRYINFEKDHSKDNNKDINEKINSKKTSYDFFIKTFIKRFNLTKTQAEKALNYMVMKKIIIYDFKYNKFNFSSYMVNFYNIDKEIDFNMFKN